MNYQIHIGEYYLHLHITGTDLKEVVSYRLPFLRWRINRAKARLERRYQIIKQATA